MQQSLERRIDALEQAKPTEIGKVLFIVFNTPGTPEKETLKLVSSVGVEDCQQWTRKPGESEQDFKDRAKREVKRSEYGTALLFQVD